MNLKNLSLAALPLSLFAIACAPVEHATDANPAAGAPAVTVVGEPQQCLPRSQIRQTAVRSDRVIDFEMNGGKVYRSTLAQRCPGLGLERAITYETSIDQLCTTQIVYALQNASGGFGGSRRGAACTLGEFVPVEYVR
ncbi:MAG: hypothetical protein CVT85_09590 [Alphaproteobacteria bacterium HGW-Alphaproteobacteria-7]|jgi:hypothetical protein|nr:MAG: hypothetical protein CVT85_09590 [Alphaproteobacteria bacterium HGW-Alphaproteobacteria-7]